MRENMNTIIEMNHVTKAYRRKIKSGKGIFKSSKFETKEAIKDISFHVFLQDFVLEKFAP